MNKIPPAAWNALGLLVVLGAAYYMVKTLAGKAGEVGHAVDPLNPDNVFATEANSITRALTGEADATLGTKFYDWTHADPTSFPPNFTAESWARHLRLTGQS